MNEEQQHCPNCWRRLAPGVEYCQFCHIRITTPLTYDPRPTYMRIAQGFSYATGLISGIAGIGNFALAATIAVISPFDMPPDSQQFLNNLVIMFFIASILCVIGMGLGWDTAMNAWKKKSLRPLLETAYLFFIGSMGVLEGITVEEQSLTLSNVLTWLFGLPLVALSLINLVLVIGKPGESKETLNQPYSKTEDAILDEPSKDTRNQAKLQNLLRLKLPK